MSPTDPGGHRAGAGHRQRRDSERRRPARAITDSNAGMTGATGNEPLFFSITLQIPSGLYTDLDGAGRAGDATGAWAPSRPRRAARLTPRRARRARRAAAAAPAASAAARPPHPPSTRRPSPRCPQKWTRRIRTRASPRARSSCWRSSWRRRPRRARRDRRREADSAFAAPTAPSAAHSTGCCRPTRAGSWATPTLSDRLDTFLLRRFRPAFDGTLFNIADFRFAPDFAGGAAVIFDAYADIHPTPFLRLRAGKFKAPLGLERLQGDAGSADHRARADPVPDAQPRPRPRAVGRHRGRRRQLQRRHLQRRLRQLEPRRRQQPRQGLRRAAADPAVQGRGAARRWARWACTSPSASGDRRGLPTAPLLRVVTTRRA